MTPFARFRSAVLAMIAGSAVAPVAVAAELPATLVSGIFGDDRLIIAADRETGTVSGYLHDGACRVFFSGPLRPITQYQRPDLGESYELVSWDPQRPGATFTTTLYSRARGGFNDQITLEAGPDDANRPAACRWQISLDRAGHVANSLVGAAVVARSRPRLFELAEAKEGLRLEPKGRATLSRDSGVWVTKTYGAAWSLPGMVRITWYDPPGTPRGGYVRERDLYPVRVSENPESKALPCTMLKDGTFESLGNCATPNPDGSYAVEPDALRSAPLRFGQREFTRDDIASVALNFDHRNFPVLDIALRPEVAQHLEAETIRLLNTDVAIMVGDKTLSSARLVEPITEGRIRISGKFSLVEVQGMAGQIFCAMHLGAEQYNSPPLPHTPACGPTDIQGATP